MKGMTCPENYEELVCAVKYEFADISNISMNKTEWDRFLIWLKDNLKVKGKYPPQSMSVVTNGLKLKSDA
jgi:hypothetical protein